MTCIYKVRLVSFFYIIIIIINYIPKLNCTDCRICEDMLGLR